MVGAEEAEVSVTRQEHAEETLDARPPQFETKVGSEAEAGEAVYAGQKLETAEDSWMNCLRQLS